ncbi:MAG TPA: 4-alpha-glucanotransferase [Nitrospirae bacterium]|nr:4-alpha-glucanotransferase [Nitrospirota bacterium]
MKKRQSGILLHITSLPSRYGIGDFGEGAYWFADLLQATGQSLWQILPLNPTLTVHGNSPYNSISAFAGNPLLISPDILLSEGYLREDDTRDMPAFSDNEVSYDKVSEYKVKLLMRAYYRVRDRLGDDEEFQAFKERNAYWLDDYALFVALKEHFEGRVWNEWPDDLKKRHPGALQRYRRVLKEKIQMECFFQYLFYRQWTALRRYCNERGIRLMGDIPIYVHYDSVDVWSHPEVFQLNGDRRPLFVAGVPPDYFSSTGQLWGNPLYNWDYLKETGYRWWIERIGHNLELFDLFRVDHFRGFVAYWQVRAGEKTAIKGHWVKAPARDFFSSLLNHFGDLPIIAEDLGVITPDVVEVMEHFGFPGMKILLFAFGEDNPAHPYLPHNYGENYIVYTGTHDNNTTVGWFRNETSREDRQRLFEYIGRVVTEEDVHWELIRLAMMSVARMAIFPMQDILGLDESARMNRPSTRRGNWKWRLRKELVSDSIRERLLRMTTIYNRRG